MGTLLAALFILIAVYLFYIFYRALKPEPLEVHPHAPEAETVSGEACPLPAEETGEAEETVDEELPERLCNPETGETAAMPTSYHFAKRWIKEALVKEGLLDRIYTQSELKDPDIARRTKEALEKFKHLKKYWA